MEYTQFNANSAKINQNQSDIAQTTDHNIDLRDSIMQNLITDDQIKNNQIQAKFNSPSAKQNFISSINYALTFFKDDEYYQLQQQNRAVDEKLDRILAPSPQKQKNMALQSSKYVISETPPQLNEVQLEYVQSVRSKRMITNKNDDVQNITVNNLIYEAKQDSGRLNLASTDITESQKQESPQHSKTSQLKLDDSVSLMQIRVKRRPENRSLIQIQQDKINELYQQKQLVSELCSQQLLEVQQQTYVQSGQLQGSQQLTQNVKNEVQIAVESNNAKIKELQQQINDKFHQINTVQHLQAVQQILDGKPQINCENNYEAQEIRQKRLPIQNANAMTKSDQEQYLSQYQQRIENIRNSKMQHMETAIPIDSILKGNVDVETLQQEFDKPTRIETSSQSNQSTNQVTMTTQSNVQPPQNIPQQPSIPQAAQQSQAPTTPQKQQNPPGVPGIPAVSTPSGPPQVALAPKPQPTTGQPAPPGQPKPPGVPGTAPAPQNPPQIKPPMPGPPGIAKPPMAVPKIPVPAPNIPK